MYRLLQRLEDEHGILKAEVLQAARIGDGISKSHLSQYMTRPGARPSERLSKKVRTFRDIACEAAKLAKLPINDVLLEVWRVPSSLLLASGR
jgi:hypothetical protein